MATARVLNVYTWTYLSSDYNCIRLVTLEPGNIDDEVVCTVERGLWDRRDYEALSYVWGESSSTETIALKPSAAHLSGFSQTEIAELRGQPLR